mgnify:CR=1 FL=1|jgi:hypothetical protein
MTNAKTPKKKPPPARDRSGALYAVVGEDVLERLNAWVEKLNESATGPRWTRQDLVKAVLVRACNERGEKGETP